MKTSHKKNIISTSLFPFLLTFITTNVSSATNMARMGNPGVSRRLNFLFDQTRSSFHSGGQVSISTTQEGTRSANRRENAIQEQDDTSMVAQHQRRQMFLRDIAEMNSFQGLVMDADNGTCKADSVSMFQFPYALEDPFWFYYSSNPLQKDFSSYFSCSNISCNFTDLLEAMRAPCELPGGVLYSLNMNQTCNGDYYNNSYVDINIPLCLAPSCAINETFIENSDSFNFCIDQRTFSSEVVQEDPVISAQCDAERNSFSVDAGSGDPNFVYDIASFDENCIFVNDTSTSGTNTTIEICDFKPYINSLKGPCEAEGGILWKFSDRLLASAGYYYDTPYESVFKNVPVCVGSSCDFKNYFENFIFPYYEFDLSGDFVDTGGYYGYNSSYYGGNSTILYTVIYEPIEYAPVLGSEKPYDRFLLKSEVVDGTEVFTTHKCKWLTKRKARSKENICSKKKYQIYSDEVGAGPASLTCVDTCAPYCHEEKGDAKFLYQGKNGVITKQCKWLQNQPTDVAATICSKIVVSGGKSIYGQAAETCTSTCGTC